MKRTLQVVLGNAATPVGTLYVDIQRGRQSTAFEYHRSWLQRADGFALDPSLPRVPGPQFRRRSEGGSAFHPAIAETEPDGWARRVILRDHAKRRQADPTAIGAQPLADVDFLLAVDDATRAGALRMVDEHGVAQRQADPRGRGTPPLLALGMLAASARAVEQHRETLADLDFLRGRATSLGGLRPKCAVVDDDGALCIGKFPSAADTRAVTAAEVLTMQLAQRAGIDAADVRLVHSDGVPVALVRRFDRDIAGDRRLYVSAATLLGAEPGDATEHTYTEIVDALRVHGSHAQQDIHALWRRIAFNVLVTNVDDHLHNHGFLHAEGSTWRLSPAFDLNPFPERQRELKTWISETTGPQASIAALLSVVEYFGIKPSMARKILREVNAAVATWRAHGHSLGLAPAELDSLAPAFEHLERAAAIRAAQ